MPFKSKAQQRWMFAAESRGEVPKGTARRWAHHTKNIESLPERKRKKKAALCLLVDDLQKTAALRKIAAYLQKRAEGETPPAASPPPQVSYPGPMQPTQAGQPSDVAMQARRADNIAKSISQFGSTHRGRAAYERLAQYRRGAVRGYAAASQPEAKERFQQALGKSGKAQNIGTPFMDGFIRYCVEQDLSGEQMADLLEKAAERTDRLGEEARSMIDRMLKL